MDKMIIRNGRLINPENQVDEITDLFIENGKIKKIAKSIDINQNETIRSIDATGKWVLPGLIDMHAHFRDPGFTEDEDLESGSRCAAIGGYTTVVVMPDTKPSIDNPVVMEYVESKAKRIGLINILPAGAISKNREGKELAPLYSMYDAGTRLFTDDGNSIHNADLMRMALQYSKIMDALICVHEDCTELSVMGVMREGYKSSRMGLVGIPASAETTMIVRDLVLAEETGSRIHINEVSNQISLDYIRFAKNRKVNVTTGVSVHHLVLNENEVGNFNKNAKISPPLGTEKDRIALIEGIRDDTIDVIVTSHDPHNPTSKIDALNYHNPSGILGMEVALSLIIEELVNKNNIPISQVIHKMSYFPAQLLGLKGKGSLKVGLDADIIIVDPEKEWTYKHENSYSKSKNDPYNGRKMKGKVEYTIIGGRLVVEKHLFI